MIEDIQTYPSGLIRFTDRTPDDFTATIALTRADLDELLAALNLVAVQRTHVYCSTCGSTKHDTPQHATNGDELADKHHPGYLHAYKAGRCIYRGCSHRQPLDVSAEPELGARDPRNHRRSVDDDTPTAAELSRIDRQERAARRKEMAQEMRDSYAR